MFTGIQAITMASDWVFLFVSFFLSFKTMFKLHRSNDWCFSQSGPMPLGCQVQRQSQQGTSRGLVLAIPRQFSASPVLQQTTSTSDLRAEGATHTDPSMLDTFTG